MTPRYWVSALSKDYYQGIAGLVACDGDGVAVVFGLGKHRAGHRQAGGGLVGEVAQAIDADEQGHAAGHGFPSHHGLDAMLGEDGLGAADGVGVATAAGYERGLGRGGHGGVLGNLLLWHRPDVVAALMGKGRRGEDG